MKHIELIELLYKHRYIIDQAFRGEEPHDIPSDLIDEVAVFQKVAKRYELSDSYVQFASAMLKRVDANYTFGDYNEEIKLLMRQKSDYLEIRDKTLLVRIKELIRTLYKKIEQRDVLINARINDIVNDNDLSIELIIKDANGVDERIADLINAHSENLKILGSELRGLDEELDEMLVDICIDLLPLAESIHSYNKRLSDFILRTEKRKEQNRKLMSLSTKIFKETDVELRSLILSHPELYHHTIKEHKGESVKTLPGPLDFKNPSFLELLIKTLKIDKTPRLAQVQKPYILAVSVELKVVKFDTLLDDIANIKPNDLFAYILHHDEITKFNDEGEQMLHAFKAYLTIMQNSREHIGLEPTYNTWNIRVAKWI